MSFLLNATDYLEVQQKFSMEELWRLFDGDRENMNLAHECVDRHRGKGRAITVKHDNGRLEYVDFDQLIRDSSQFAHFLQERNISKGDRVALVLEPGRIFYACLFGAIKRGAIAVPLFTLFGPDGLALRIKDCEPAIIVAHEVDAIRVQYPSIPVIKADEQFFNSLDKYPSDFKVATKSKDLCVYQYTSGTTRELPEAVKHSQRSVVTLMIAALFGTGLRPGDIYFCPSSPAWGHGLWHGTIAPLALGIQIVAYSGKFQAKTVLEALQELKVNNFAAAATVYRMLRRESLESNYHLSVSKCTFTGEPLDAKTFDWVTDYFGVSPSSIYGTTEVGVIMVDYPGMKGHLVKRGALGKPAPGNDVTILSESGEVALANEIGEIAVKRKGEWFRVKDFGYYDDEGYFFHSGRSDDVIISAGWTMSAVEIENILLTHVSVAEAAVIGVPDETRGQIPKGYVVIEKGFKGDAELLKQYMKERLSQHEYPRDITFMKDLPKTPAGKVNRKVLRDGALRD